LQSETWEIQTKQADGGGGMLSFRVKSPALVGPLLSSLRLIAFAESLGGVETLITYPHTQTHADIPEETRRKVGVCDRLLRLSVGIEYVDDLIADLAQALDQAERAWKEEKRDEVCDPIAPQW
jgi:cystathionine gamma-synthase